MKHICNPSLVEPHVLYHLSEFQSRLGWGKHAMRTARRKGLKVIDMGGRRYVHGRDFFDYLETIRKEATPATAV